MQPAIRQIPNPREPSESSTDAIACLNRCTHRRVLLSQAQVAVLFACNEILIHRLVPEFVDRIKIFLAAEKDCPTHELSNSVGHNHAHTRNPLF